MIEIFVVGCVMTIALFLAVFERKNVVKGDEVVSIGPGHWTVPNGDQKLGDTSSGSSDESDQESEPENEQQIATQDYARCVQLRLHRFGEYRTRKEVNDLLILLVYYYTVIIKVLGVLLSNQSKEQLSIVRNVSTVTLYKEEEEFPLDDELPESTSKKKKTKSDKQTEEVYMPICLRKDDEAMYHEASIDNLDILITQRQKIESYISHLSESDVDIVKAVPAALEKQPSITHDESNVLFNVSIEKNIKDDVYKPLIKKDAIISDIESLQANIGDPKDDVNNELETLKTKLGYDLTQKLKPESSIDESDASMPTLKSMSLDDSDLDVSSSQITESEVTSTEVESFPDKSNNVLVDQDSVIPIVDLIEKVKKDNEQTPDQTTVYENSYHTGAIPKYSHPDTSKAVTSDQTSNSVTPAIQVESFKEKEKKVSESESLICESKPVNTQETSKAEIVKLKSVEKDILDGSEDEDLEEDTEDSDVSIPDMKGSYTLQHEDYGVEEIYEDRDPLAFLLEGNEAEDDLSENFVDSFFSDESAPCAPVAEPTYQIDPILEEESEEESSEDDDGPGPLQLKVPTVIEEKFAMTFSLAVDDDENIDHNQCQADEKIVEEKKPTDEINLHIDNTQCQDDEKTPHTDILEENKHSDEISSNIDNTQSQDGEKIPCTDIIEEKKHTDEISSHIDIHNYQNGNKQKEVLHKIKDLADKLEEIKNQELNVDCTVVEDITEDVVTIELDNHLDTYGDKPCNSKLDQCKSLNANDNFDNDIANKEVTTETQENGILSSNVDEDVSSMEKQFQDFSANEQIKNVDNNVDVNEKSIETNFAKESENTCIGDSNEIAIEFDTPDMHFNEAECNYAKKNEDIASIGDMNEMANEFEAPNMHSKEVKYNYAENNDNIRSIEENNEMAIEFESPYMHHNEVNCNYAESNDDIRSIEDENEMIIEFETPDMNFNLIQSIDHNSDIINDIDELSISNSSDLPSEATIVDMCDQNALSIEIDQRTSSDIDNSVVSDKDKQLYSEQDSVISIDKGEEVLCDISEDLEYSSIDRCKAFSADADPPEDFEYEGEAEYHKTVKLENFKNLENLQAAVVSADECSHKIVLDVHEFRHGDLRVSAVGETEILVEAVSEVPEHEAMQVRKFRQKFLLPETAAATDSIAALSSDGVLAIITPKKDGTSPSIKRKLPEDVETPEKSSKMTKNDPRSNETEKSTIIDREMVECFMPILQRGNFFTDSIFQETRQDFNTAITEVLDKWGERSVHDPERGTHREEPKEDNQILVDIADFTQDGEVKINVMDEELVVEGRTKKAEGSATSVKTFIRRFTLAPDIDPSAVTSVVTPDGILEITTPKKTVIPKLKEFSIQVIIELIVEESHTSPRKDSKSRKKLKDKSPGKDTDSSHSRKKKKMHPEDVIKHDAKQQDAKPQQEQTQELMEQAWDAETSSGTITGVSEANKNKLSSDEAKSMEAKVVPQKEAKGSKQEKSKKAKALEAKSASQKDSKASELEGSENKLPSTSECKAEVSEVSRDVPTKESENLEKKQIAQDEASKQLTDQAKTDALSKSPSTKEQQVNATADSSIAGELISTAEQEKLNTAESTLAEQQKLVNTESSVAGEPKLSTEEQKLATAEISVGDENKLTAEQQKLDNAESSVAGEPKLTVEQQKLANAESSVTSEPMSTGEQQKIATAESSVSGENKLTAEQQKIENAESSVAGESKLTAEQEKLATAESYVAGEPKLIDEQQKLATAESSVAGEPTLTDEQQKLATEQSSVAGEAKLSSEQQKLTSEESSVAGDLNLSTDQQKLANAESSAAGEINLNAERLATAESSDTCDLKLSTEQQKPATAESSDAGELKLTSEQQELHKSESSAISELKSTTEQQKLETAKDVKSEEDSLKPTTSADTSIQSTSEEGGKAELSSSQQEEIDTTSTAKKSIKQKTEKAVSDESVRSKKPTIKKDVSEKQDTESGKSSSTAKLGVQSSVSSSRKEEEKSISPKDAKALFQSQAPAAAGGSTSDLRSAGRSSSSLGLSGTRSMSSSYQTLPGSSSPSSGYLATGTKSIASGSFTFKATEEYIKKKPPPRNRPFFNLRDFL